jgi:hypothetical protein
MDSGCIQRYVCSNTGAGKETWSSPELVSSLKRQISLPYPTWFDVSLDAEICLVRHCTVGGWETLPKRGERVGALGI